MKKYEFDAVVIGSGCAGYNCADWLYDLGCKNIAIITEGKNKGTSRNTGSDKQTYYKLSLAGNDGDSIYGMAETLFNGGAMDGDVALAEAANSVRSFMKLANLGVMFPCNEYGEYVGYKTDHDPYCRATSIGPYTSKRMTEVLEKSVERKGIIIMDQMQVIRILTDQNRVTGVLALNTQNKNNAEWIVICSPYVVLATGGPAAIYYDSVYPVSHTGNSSLALSAGAEFANLSEWQYGLASTDFRWNVSGTYQQVLPRYISIDNKGVEREFLKEHFSSNMEMMANIFLKGYEWPFDVRKIYGSSYIDLLVYRENVLLGRNVYLDFTREPSEIEITPKGIGKTAYSYLKNSNALLSLPIERLNKMNPGAISLYKAHGIDLWKDPLKIAVCAQHNNGGIRIDSHWQTSVHGLYAVGEVAGSLGIFRPGGTALNSCQVGGLRAAEHIVFEGKGRISPHFDMLAKQAITEAEKMISATHNNISLLKQTRTTYQKRMSRDFAFLRDIPTMKSSLSAIRASKICFEEENQWSDISEIPDLFKNLDIILMQEAVAQTIYDAAKKFGSRGAGMVLNGGDFMDRQPYAEDSSGRNLIMVLKKDAQNMKDGKISLFCVPVRPIPERDLWFERVWNQYREKTSGSQKEI